MYNMIWNCWGGVDAGKVGMVVEVSAGTDSAEDEDSAAGTAD